MEFLLFIAADIVITIYLIYSFKKYQEKKAIEYFMNQKED